jgi:hypothetical protein
MWIVLVQERNEPFQTFVDIFTWLCSLPLESLQRPNSSILFTNEKDQSSINLFQTRWYGLLNGNCWSRNGTVSTFVDVRGFVGSAFGVLATFEFLNSFPEKKTIVCQIFSNTLVWSCESLWTGTANRFDDSLMFKSHPHLITGPNVVIAFPTSSYYSYVSWASDRIESAISRTLDGAVREIWKLPAAGFVDVGFTPMKQKNSNR